MIINDPNRLLELADKNPKKFEQKYSQKARRTLFTRYAQLKAASRINDLLPSSTGGAAGGWEQLKYQQQNTYSAKLDGKWRLIVHVYENEVEVDIDIDDYHRRH